MPTIAAVPAPLRSIASRWAFGPHGPDAYLAAISPIWSSSRILARVDSIIPEASDAATVILRPNANWPGFRAGQHVQLTVSVDGIRRTRTFSLSSAEQDRDRIAVTVRRSSRALVSRHLVFGIRPGDTVELSAPAGEFVLPAGGPDAAAPLLLIAGGSGITPLMSMLRSRSRAGRRGPVALIYYARRESDRIFAAQLRLLAAGDPDFRYLPLTTGDGAQRFSAATLAQLPFAAAGAATYACGPAALLAAVESLWSECGWSAQLRVEHFAAPSTPAAADAAGGQVVFARSERRVTSDGRVLLEQAEAAGLDPDHGCRRGLCRTCTCTLLAGQVRHVASGAIVAEPGESFTLCSHVPVGDVAVDL
jgi:ferredoxin-NADP reductase